MNKPNSLSDSKVSDVIFSNGQYNSMMDEYDKVQESRTFTVFTSPPTRKISIQLYTVDDKTVSDILKVLTPAINSKDDVVLKISQGPSGWQRGMLGTAIALLEKTRGHISDPSLKAELEKFLHRP